MIINSRNFDSVYNVFNSNTIYVIPTFQRPYAWEEKQLSDLTNDIFTCCNRKNSYHYLSPIHLVQVDSSNDTIWKNYTDINKNNDIKHISNSDFTDDNNGNFDVYLVVDGQQRLTTLFSLLFVISAGKSNIFTIPCNGNDIPKVILNPSDDHQYFRKMLSLPFTAPSTTSKSQIRLENLFSTLRKTSFSPQHQKFILSRDHVSLLINLDANHGLQTFLTLNDRGKDLTIFERLKSLFMDYDFNYSNPSNPVSIHSTFGEVYKILDRQKCYIDEDQFVQLSAIDLWVSNNIEIPSKSADSVYKNNYRNTSPSSGNVGTDLHSRWLPTFINLSKEIDDLTSYLDGSNSLCSNSSNFLSIRTVGDDYQIIFESLGLSLRSIAMLFKFRRVYGNEWHDIICPVNFNNHGIVNILKATINTIIGELSNIDEENDILKQKADSIFKRIQSVPLLNKKDVSALHLSEIMELVVFKMGSTKPGNYSWAYDYINSSNKVCDAAQRWLDYITSYSSRDNFFHHLLSASPDVRDSRFKYVLHEYEFYTYSKNIHFNKDLQIEHIFPQDQSAFGPSLGSYGFSTDYNSFIESLGNKIFLDSKLNAAIKNQLPSVKAKAYATQSYAKTTAIAKNQTQSSIDLGNELISVTNPIYYKYNLMLRRLELILFALQRF